MSLSTSDHRRHPRLIAIYGTLPSRTGVPVLAARTVAGGVVFPILALVAVC